MTSFTFGVRPNRDNRPSMPVVDRSLFLTRAERAQAAAARKAELAAERKRRAEIAEREAAERAEENAQRARAALVAVETVEPAAVKRGPTDLEPIAPGLLRYRVNDLIALAAAVTETRVHEIKGTSRVASTVKARQLTFWLLRVFTDRSLPDLGARTGGRDHTTVLHGIRRAERAALVIPGFNRNDPYIAAKQLWAADWRSRKGNNQHAGPR